MKRLISLALVMALAFASTLIVLADPVTDAKSRLNSIDSQLDKVQSDKKRAQQEQKQIQNNINNLKSQQTLQDKSYEELIDQINFLNQEVAKINAAVEDAENKYNHQKDVLKTRLRVMYENTDSSFLDILIQSESLTDFMERVEIISIISQNDKQMVDELKVAKLDVEFKKKLKEDEVGARQDEAANIRQQIEQLSISRSALENEIRKSSQKLKKLEEQEDALLRESENLANYLRSVQKGGNYAGGSMIWPYPANRSIGSRFGMRYHPILKINRMHNGIDIGGRSNDDIVAVNKGTVIVAGYSSGYGNNVVIDHGGGISTLYAHASKLLVKVGDTVSAGQTIAKVGSTGLSTGPHLHFEVRKNGTPVNPLDYVSP